MSTTEPPVEGAAQTEEEYEGGEVESDEESEALVRDIMTAPVITVDPELSVKDLAALFREQRIGGVPVVQDGKLIGIVTEGDMMAMDADIQYPHWFELFDSVIYLGSQKKFKEQLEKASAANVEQLMTHREKVMTVGPDDPARKAATLMVKHHFDRVPVVDEDDNLLGLVTRHDIMKLIGL
jgi:CBS domain-containing protein